MTRAFWKSKTFWAGIGSIVTGVSVICTTGHVSTEAILAIGSGIMAIVGRAQATGPIGMSDSGDAAKNPFSR
jgi:hypothetical protein